MYNKKRIFRKITRMLVTLVCCFPLFWLIAGLLDKRAKDFLTILINLVVGGTILFIVYIIGEKNDEKRVRLHEEHEAEIRKRKLLEKASKGNKEYLDNASTNGDNDITKDGKDNII